MKEKPLNIVEQADYITALRNKEVSYKSITKKELWRLINTLMDHPALGLEDRGTPESFREEARRVLSVCLSPEGIDPASAVSIVGGSLNYDTLLVFNQITHQHVAALADARKIVYSRPGEVEELTVTVKQIIDTSKEHEELGDPKDQVIEVKIPTFLEFFQYVLSMANSADLILDLVDSLD